MTAFENLSASQKLRATLHRDVRALCTETLHLLGMEMTKPAMEIVAELVYRKLSVYATDLEAFAKHAKRNTIAPEDVRLLVRRNPSLKTLLNTIQPSNPLAKDKRRKTVTTASSTNRLIATPVPKPKDASRPNSDGKRKDEGDKGIETDSDKNRAELGEDMMDVTETGMDLGETRKDLDDSANLGEGCSKISDFLDSKITNEARDMSVEDTIDLTFD